MSDEKATPAPEEPQHTSFDLGYAGESKYSADEGQPGELALFGNLRRDPVQLQGKIKRPLPFREAMAALHGVVSSDYRYVPKDRTAYQAYRRMRQQSENLSTWQAQQAYFDWLSRNDPLAWLILDPVVSVHPDRLTFEVFSKDEGAYANLSFKHDALELEGEPSCGVTNIDFSQALADSVQRMRSYRETKFSIGQQAVQVETETAEKVLEKQIRVPDTWMRGFLQVQSAAILPRETFSLSPIDLYNVLRQLRLHADQKKKRRGLRVELSPGEAPRLVLEPWEIVVPSSAGNYTGRMSRVIRIWGRRRLMLLQRVLPFAKKIDVHVLGPGLPSFWVLEAEDFTLTLGLTGFTSANWSQALSFDLLLPRKTQTGKSLEKVVKHLAKSWFDTRENIGKACKLEGEALIETLQQGCQQGQLMYDLAADVYRLRPLTDQPLDLSRLEYRNQRERIAHDLLTRKNAVKIVSENRIYGTGLELTGEVKVAEDKRDYRPQILIDEDGRVTKADCTCSAFRKQGLKGGPCSCLISLRLKHAQLEAARLESGKARQTTVLETRTYSKRDAAGKEDVYQVTLDRQSLRIRWGQAGQNLRTQRLRFNSQEEARDAYFARVDELEARGYLDATAS